MEKMREETKSIYLLFTQTYTFSAFLIRSFGKVKYNHCAIAMDKELNQLYSFARPQQHGLFLGKLVKETKDRYTRNDTVSVPCALVEIPLSSSQYALIQKRIQEIELDKEYMYNFMSVLTYPISGGFQVYKSYSCVEFTASLMQLIDSSLTQPAYSYTPDELLKRYLDFLVYHGDLREYMSLKRRDEHYYAAMTLSLICLNVYGIYKIIKRCAFSLLLHFL